MDSFTVSLPTLFPLLPPCALSPPTPSFYPDSWTGNSHVKNWLIACVACLCFLLSRQTEDKVKSQAQSSKNTVISRPFIFHFDRKVEIKYPFTNMYFYSYSYLSQSLLQDLSTKFTNHNVDCSHYSNQFRSAILQN